MPERDVDPVEVVRCGYDALSWRYRADDAPTGQYEPWIAELIERTPAGGRVLDVGCGVPVARDLSDVQIHRARPLVPTARFEQGDVTAMSWPTDSFDTIVALYSLIHVPLHAPRPNGLATPDQRPNGEGYLLTLEGSWVGRPGRVLGYSIRSATSSASLSPA